MVMIEELDEDLPSVYYDTINHKFNYGLSMNELRNNWGKVYNHLKSIHDFGFDLDEIMQRVTNLYLITARAKDEPEEYDSDASKYSDYDSDWSYDDN